MEDSSMRPDTLADWLQWAIVSCAAAQLPELQLRYVPGEILARALMTSQLLFVVLDEIDTPESAQDSREAEGSYGGSAGAQPARRCVELRILSDRLHFIICSYKEDSLMHVIEDRARGPRRTNTDTYDL
jgi:hypothetical protein